MDELFEMHLGVRGFDMGGGGGSDGSSGESEDDYWLISTVNANEKIAKCR